MQDSAAEKEALQSAVKENVDNIQALEGSYAFANEIVQSNTISEEVQDLLSSDKEPEIIGATLNASEGESVDFVISEGADVELQSAYEKEISLDLSLEVGGSEVSDLAIPAQITMPVPSGISTDNLTLYHEHGGKVEEVDITVSGDEVTFMTDGFSNFIFAGSAAEETSVPDSGNSSSDNSSSGSSSSGSSGSGSSSGGRSSSSGKTHAATKGWVSYTNGIITGEGSSYSRWQAEQAADGSIKWKLIYADGSAAAGTMLAKADGTIYEQVAWELVDGVWYPFGADGYVKYGWVQDKLLGGIFYIDTNQGMVTGWQKLNNQWYYFNPVSDGTKGMMRVNAWIDGWYVGADGTWDQKPQVVNQ